MRRKFKDKIHVVQRKPVLQKKRLEVAPRFGLSFNDPLYRSFKVGGNINYHIAERFFVGATLDWYNFGGALGGTTDTYDQVISQTSSAPNTPVPNWSAGLELGVVPIFGKFSFFNGRLGFYDVGLTLGGAFVNASTLESPAASGPGGTVSIFNHIFLSEWVSLNFEIRDTIYTAALASDGSSSISHALTAAVGFGLFLPRRFEYTEPENKPSDD